MERRKFTREFKLEAVRLIKDRGVSYVQASQDLGVHPTQLGESHKLLAGRPHRARRADASSVTKSHSLGAPSAAALQYCAMNGGIPLCLKPREEADFSCPQTEVVYT